MNFATKGSCKGWSRCCRIIGGSAQKPVFYVLAGRMHAQFSALNRLLHTICSTDPQKGAEVIAVADGVVSWSADRYGYGQMVEINHGNGYSTRYAHNSENLVSVGEEVRKGQTVALMGETGRATGPNLHFEVLRRGQRVNPVKFIRQSSN